ncbi:glycosyltransferase [Alteromonas gilva]|uniref:Glycosyltransferase n=1 Tax=Alteromonas gilva TaxID=2987522 RepID=A0ABT5KZX9_9ALTE|nr:glycosyltransferase [Alteromonas gilva]MDC8830325.1 glycosyltransferase [Alteromonas gilva]
MKRIIHVVHRLDIGGLERVLLNCVNTMPATEFEHRIITLTGHSAEFAALLQHHIEVISLNKRDGNDWRIFKRFYNEIKRFKPDCVHSYNLATIELQGVAWFAGVKLRIHAEHGRDIVDPDGTNTKYRLMRKVLAKFIHRIVAVSEDLHSWLRDDVHIASSKLRLIVNGIDTAHFSPLSTPRHRNTFVFGHVGRLAQIKNQALLINAFYAATQRSPEFAEGCVLKIVGGGECLESLAQLIDDLQLAEKVVLAGPKLDIKAEYDGMDIFVMSSLAEGIPMTLLESMSCGVPPVVTRVGGIPEVVNAQCGRLYDSGNTQQLADIMVDLFSHRSQVSALGDKARDTIVAQYSEKSMVEAYIRLYRGEW